MAASLVTFAQTDPSLTNAGVIHYTLAFSELVTGVDASAFTLTTNGVTGASIDSVAEVALSGGTQYVVAVNTGSGNGTIALNFVGASVLDGAGDPLSDLGFLPQVPYATGLKPYFVAIGDLDGDLLPDLAIADHTSNAVSVLLGKSDGTFHAQVSYTTGTQPISVAIGDLNADTKPDLVLSNFGSGDVSVLLGNGDGTFQSQVSYDTGRSAYSVAIADLNGDTKPDLAVANAYGSQNVTVLLGNGDGTFQHFADYPTDPLPDSLVIGDLNGDLKQDLVTANLQSNSVSVLLGNGDGTFHTQATYATGAAPRSVSLGYLNSDTYLDFAVANYGSSTVSVFLGNGDGTFQAQAVSPTTGANPYSVAIRDLDGDGKADLAVADLLGNTVSVLLGNGDGTFQGRVAYATEVGAKSVAIANLDGDGRPDLVVANVFSNTVSVLLHGRQGGAYTIDHTAPLTPVITGISSDTGTVGDHKTKDTSLTLKGTADHGAMITLYKDGTSVGTTTADSRGNWSLADGETLAGGTTYRFTATATDAAGNASHRSAGFDVIIDTTVHAPTLAVDRLIDSSEVDGTKAGYATFTVSNLDADASAVVSFTDGIVGHAAVTMAVPSNGPYEVNLQSLSDGTIHSSIRVMDTAGNTAKVAGNDAILNRTDAFTLTVGQYRTLAAAPSELGRRDVVVLRDSGANLATLTSFEFLAAPHDNGVVSLDARGGTLALTVAQYQSLGTVVLSAADKVVIVDTGAHIAGIADFSALSGKLVDRLDASDDVLSLSVAQYQALLTGGTILTSKDLVTLADTGANLEALSIPDMAALASHGVDRLDASDDTLSLGAGQFAAIRMVAIASNDQLSVAGTGGKDSIAFSRTAFSVDDKIDGAADVDTLALTGNYGGGLVFNDDTMTNIERLSFGAHGSYDVTLADANLGAGVLYVSAASLGVGDSLIFDGSHETTGAFRFTGGGGTNTFTGGTKADQIGAGGGGDTLRYTAGEQSTGATYDTVTGFNAASDKFQIAGFAGFDGTVAGGTLSIASFDANMIAAMAGHLGVHDAILFTADAGKLAGASFLVADMNGIAGYQSGDLAVRLTSTVGAIGSGNFS